MRPVTQKFMVEKDDAGEFTQRGDCLPACLASIFEIPIEDIPHFNNTADWWGTMIAWLNGRGFALWQSPSPITYPTSPLCIVSGKSPRDPENVTHAVVGRGRSLPRYPKGEPMWEVVHDPHPDGTGIHGEPQSFWYFIALDPARLK